jgi:hypothetical protein
MINEKDIRGYGPRLHLYHRHGDRDGHSANRLNRGAMKESIPSLRGRLAVKAEKFEGHPEATKALALSMAGVMVAMLMWGLMMLLFY